MRILAIVGKGGTGKTTTTINLAIAAHLAGQTVAIVDLDSQATATNWGDRREQDDIGVVSCQVGRLKKILHAAQESGATFTIIDTPGKTTDVAISAANEADLLLIPSRPQLFDIETLEHVRQIQMVTGNNRAMVVINQAPIQGDRHIVAMKGIMGQGFDVASTVMFLRVAYGDSTNAGQGAGDFEPTGKAAQEIARLYSEVATRIGLSSHTQM